MDHSRAAIKRNFDTGRRAANAKDMRLRGNSELVAWRYRCCGSEPGLPIATGGTPLQLQL